MRKFSLKPKCFSSFIQPDEYSNRRSSLQSMLPNNSTLLVPGFGLRYATGSIFYPFHQNTDLLYLTGFNEPNAFMFLKKSEMDMFVQPYDPMTEIWDGKRIGIEGAKVDYGASNAYPIHKLESSISALLNEDAIIITDLPLDSAPKINMLAGTFINTLASSATHISHPFQETANRCKAELRPVGTLIQQLRLYKSEAERNIMRTSGKIAGRAFAKAMKQTRPGLTEHQLHAILEYEIKMNGASGLSYVPVVASGKNALILHYVSNQDVLKDGDLVLVDCGAEYSNYASDITRTWPVNGKFTLAQSKLYQLVLDVQKKMISKCVAFEASADSLHEESFEMLRKGLSLLFDRTVSVREMRYLYPHHLSHYIGLDVHDTPSVPRSKPLEVGMTLTIGKMRLIRTWSIHSR
jgi:intermediate cleaving peptidase 55